IDRMAEITLEKIDPIRKAVRSRRRASPCQNEVRVPEVKTEQEESDKRSRTRYVSAEASRAVVLENGGRGCDFVDAQTGKRCGSHFQLQKDHVVPWSKGGANEASNLQMLCAGHNRWRWTNRSSRSVRTPHAGYEVA
ncbi:MAG: HNH endonuclease, partial [Proteobacteria bacterium]